MRRQLPCEWVNDETRVARGKMARDRRVFFLVPADIAHRRKTARDGVRAGGDRLAKREVSESRHDARGRSVAVRKAVGNRNVRQDRHSRCDSKSAARTKTICAG